MCPQAPDTKEQSPGSPGSKVTLQERSPPQRPAVDALSLLGLPVAQGLPWSPMTPCSLCEPFVLHGIKPQGSADGPWATPAPRPPAFTPRVRACVGVRAGAGRAVHLGVRDADGKPGPVRPCPPLSLSSPGPTARRAVWCPDVQSQGLVVRTETEGMRRRKLGLREGQAWHTLTGQYLPELGLRAGRLPRSPSVPGLQQCPPTPGPC